VGDDDLFFALNSHYPLLLKIYLFLDSILSKVQYLAHIGGFVIGAIAMFLLSKTKK
jgi:membrane associated rhomboid family serine protease